MLRSTVPCPETRWCCGLGFEIDERCLAPLKASAAARFTAVGGLPHNQDVEVGIRRRPDLLDRLERSVCSFEREAGPLNRKSDVRRGHQALTAAALEPGTVDDDVSVITPQLVYLVLQSEVRVELPTNLASSLARPILAGALQVLKRRGRWMIRERSHTGSAIASDVLCSIGPWPRNEIQLLAWVSRSMIGVSRSLRASAAAGGGIQRLPENQVEAVVRK